MLLRIRQNRCCTIHLVGHQGVSAKTGGTDGGVVTYPDPNDHDKKVPILPNESFEQQLRAAFGKNCKKCAIYIYACGGYKPESDITRQAIADNTGCTVYGAMPDPKGRGPAGAITVGDPGEMNSYCTMIPGVEADPETSCIGSVTFKEFPPANGKELRGSVATP